MLEQYPYALGQTKGGDTSLRAQIDASENKNNDRMRSDVLNLIGMSGVAMSADCIAQNMWFRTKWRERYQNEHHYLQDIRRRCSELRKLEKIGDSGVRTKGIGGKSVACWTTKAAGIVKKKPKDRTAAALAMALKALEHYGQGSNFHTGTTARQAINNINIELGK